MAEKKKKKLDPDGVVLIADNRRARYDFELGETLECGIALVGAEVKSLRNKAISFADAFADISNGELWLHNVKIDRYKQSTVDVVEPARRRRLLANAREIEKFRKLIQERGYTLIPLKLYFRGPWAKCLVGLAKGKNKGDKRDTIRAREADRDVARVMRRG